jgi:hypothetical protein
MLGSGDSDRSTQPGATAPAAATVRGTIQALDTKAQKLSVSADASSPQLSLRNGSSQVLSYDASTAVSYQGRSYQPEDLEVGDRIEAMVERSEDRLVARRIDVLSDVSADAGGQNVPAQMEATVRWVDNANRTIELEPMTGERRPVIAQYDASTRVEFEGRAYRPEDLERGDQVRVRTRSDGGRLIADEISVVRNSRAADAGGAGQPAANRALVRGTIRQIDTSAQRIALDSAAWSQSFDERAGSAAAAFVSYDAQTVVEYQGKRYGIANLEPGDQVEIEVDRGSSGDYRAQRIVVTRGA